MVKIEPPANKDVEPNLQPPQVNQPPQAKQTPQVKLGNTPVDSEAITEDGIAPELPDVSETAGGQPKSGFANAPPIPNPESTDPSHSDPHLSERDTLAGPPPTWQDNENWQSEKTRRTRHIAMIATIALSTLSVAVLTFGWLMRLQKPESQQVAQTPEVPTPEVVTVNPAPDAETSLPDSAPDDEGLETPTETPTEEPGKEVVTPSDQSPETTTETPTMPETPSVFETSSDPDAIDVSPTTIPPSLIPTSPIASPDSPPDETIDEDAPTMTELPAGLQQYIPQMLLESPAETTSLDAPPTINQVEIDAAAEEESNTLGIAPPKPINLKRDLGFKVAFNSKGYPLPSLLLLISEMTGVPIQIDWTSFDIAGVDVAKPIKVVGAARTCRNWLDAIAAQVDAEIREKQFVIVMTVNDQAFAKAKTDLLDLADFEPQADSAAVVIQNFMRTKNEAKQAGPDEGEEVEEDKPEAEEEVAVAPVDVMELREKAQLKILATELLRRMRSITPKLSNDRAKRWMQINDNHLTDWQPISDVDPAELKPTPQTDTPITTAAVLRQMSSINRSVCLVNWYDANRLGLRPTRLVMPNADKGDAAKILASVLEPMSMEVRRVDPTHWWVGSGATYDRLPVLVHSDRLAGNRENYVRQIDKIMSADPDAVYQSAYDPVSDRMLMLLPRYVARQLFKVSQELAKP